MFKIRRIFLISCPAKVHVCLQPQTFIILLDWLKFDVKDIPILPLSP